MNVEQTIQIRLRELCESKNISAEELSERSHVDLETINQILSGQSVETQYFTIALFCNGLKMDLADFFQSDIFREK